MAESREGNPQPIWWQRKLGDYFDWKGTEVQEMRRQRKAARELAGLEIASFGLGSYLGKGGLLGAGYAQALMGSIKYGDQMWAYGLKEFKRGTIGQGKKLISAIS